MATLSNDATMADSQQEAFDKDDDDMRHIRSALQQAVDEGKGWQMKHRTTYRGETVGDLRRRVDDWKRQQDEVASQVFFEVDHDKDGVYRPTTFEYDYDTRKGQETRNEQTCVGFRWWESHDGAKNSEGSTKAFEPVFYGWDPILGRPTWREGPKKMPEGLEESLQRPSEGWTVVSPSAPWKSTCTIAQRMDHEQSFTGPFVNTVDRNFQAIREAKSVVDKLVQKQRNLESQAELASLASSVSSKKGKKSLRKSVKSDTLVAAGQALADQTRSLRLQNKANFQSVLWQYNDLLDEMVQVATREMSRVVETSLSMLPQSDTRERRILEGMKAMILADRLTGESWRAGAKCKWGAKFVSHPSEGTDNTSEKLAADKRAWRVCIDKSFDARKVMDSHVAAIDPPLTPDDQYASWDNVVRSIARTHGLSDSDMGLDQPISKGVYETRIATVKSMEEAQKMDLFIQGTSGGEVILRTQEGLLVKVEPSTGPVKLPALFLSDNKALGVAVTSGAHTLQKAFHLPGKVDSSFAADWVPSLSVKYPVPMESYGEVLARSLRDDLSHPKLPHKAKALMTAADTCIKHYERELASASIKDKFEKPETINDMNLVSDVTTYRDKAVHHIQNMIRTCVNELQSGVNDIRNSLLTGAEQVLGGELTVQEVDEIDGMLLPVWKQSLQERHGLMRAKRRLRGQSVSQPDMDRDDNYIRLAKMVQAYNGPNDFGSWLTECAERRSLQENVDLYSGVDTVDEAQTAPSAPTATPQQVPAESGPSQSEDEDETDEMVTEADQEALLSLAPKGGPSKPSPSPSGGSRSGAALGSSTSASAGTKPDYLDLSRHPKAGHRWVPTRPENAHVHERDSLQGGRVRTAVPWYRQTASADSQLSQPTANKVIHMLLGAIERAPSVDSGTRQEGDDDDYSIDPAEFWGKLSISS